MLNRHLILKSLFYAVKAGDASAYTKLYEYTWEKLFQFSFHKTKDEAEAKDLVQEVFIRLWQQKERIDIHGSVEAYLYTMARHEFIRRIQQDVKSREGNFNYLQLLDDFAPAEDQNLFARELQDALNVEIAALPEKQQTIYRLHQEENRSTQEIASELNVKEQTVKNQLVTAKKKIRASKRFLVHLTTIITSQFHNTTN